MSPEPSGLCNDVPGMPRPARMQLNDVFLVKRQHVTPLKSEGSKGAEGEMPRREREASNVMYMTFGGMLAAR